MTSRRSLRAASAALAAAAAGVALAIPSAEAQCPPLQPNCQQPPPQEPPPRQPAPTPPAPTQPVQQPTQPVAPAVDPRGVDPRLPNPLAGLRFYVDRDEPANRQYRFYKRKGKKFSAAMVGKIAEQPRFKWFGRWTRHGPALVTKIRDWLDTAKRRQPGAVPLMLVMRHQGKKCHQNYTAGGRREDARARKWYRRFARAVGNRRVVLAFEPDSLGTLECLKPSRRIARLKLLRYGVDVLSQLPNATMYLEGGASDWEHPRRTARHLRYIGIHKVRGFMLNVTHYDWTSSNVRHGLQLSRLTGGKHFIVSTSFNGRGAVHFRRYISRARNIWRTINVWCHPLKRGLGPTPRTSNVLRPDKVDGYMWIGRPGYSGGSCNGGPLPVGKWWAKRAVMFGRWATNWERPPRGTHYGHYRRYSYRTLGGR